MAKYFFDMQNIGWKSKLSKKRSTMSISIHKLIVDGCGLEKGQELFSYLAKDPNKRPIVVIYLDGKNKNSSLK